MTDQATPNASHSNPPSAEALAWAAEHAAPTQVHATPDDTVRFFSPVDGADFIVDLEPFLPRPRRQKASRQFTNLESLVTYAARFPLNEAAVYVGEHVRLILDDHNDAAAGWQEHRATVALRLHPTWQAVKAANAQLLDQTAFAELVESLGGNWVTPDAAEMLEIAQTIEIAGERRYASSRRLADGSTSLAFVDTTNAKAGQAGDLTVPTRVAVGCRIFEGLDVVVRLDARLRTRLKGTEVKFAVLLDKTPAEIENEARAAVADTLETMFADVASTIVPVHAGNPT